MNRETAMKVGDFLTPNSEDPNSSKYSTILSWMANNNPEALFLAEDPMCFQLDDTPIMQGLVAKFGLPCFNCTPCPFLSERGYETEVSYPNVLLEHALG